MRQNGFTLIIIIIVVVFLGILGYSAYKNISLTNPKNVITTPTNLSATSPVIITPTQNNKQTITCQEAQESYSKNSGYKDVKVTIVNDVTPGYCKLTHVNYGYTLSFKEGLITSQNGAWGQTVAFTKGDINDYKRNTIDLSVTGLADSSTLDVSQVDKIIVVAEGIRPLIDSYQRIASKTVGDINGKNVLELALAFTNNKGETNYEKYFYLINDKKRVIYSFGFYSDKSNFTNFEDVERTSLIKEMIASMKY